MKAIWILCLGLILLSACTAHIIDDERVTDTVSIYESGCTNTYEISRDCNTGDGPTRKALINDSYFDFGSNESGDIIYVQGTFGGQQGRWLIDAICLGCLDSEGEHMEQVFCDIEKTLEQSGIHIVKIVPVIRPDILFHVGPVGGNTHGYYLELDGDGYKVLDGFALEPPDEN